MGCLSRPRENVRWPAVWEDAAGVRHEGEICDVSASGAFVRVGPAVAAPVGSRVRLVFTIPRAGTRLDLGATVRWRGESSAHRCHGIGVELDGISAELEAWVERGSGVAWAPDRRLRMAAPEPLPT